MVKGSVCMTTHSEAEAASPVIEAVIAGDAQAWADLWNRIEVILKRTLRNPRIVGRMSRSPDDQRNIFVELMSRLRDDDYRRLRLYLQMKTERPGLAFSAWIRVVARRVAVDYMRGHGDYIDKRRNRNPESAAGAWVALTNLPSDSRGAGIRPAYTNRGAAMRMLRYAYSELPADQLEALELWITSTSFADIATRLGLETPKQAERNVRAALERLRRHFRERTRK